MDFTENKAVFEDCVDIIKDIQNINDIDAIRYLVSEDLDRAKEELEGFIEYAESCGFLEMETK